MVDEPAPDLAFEHELAVLLIGELNLEATPEEIDPLEPLYKGPLGLDSIDILEIALCTSKQYQVTLRADDADNQQIFSTLRSLANYLKSHGTAG